MPKPEITEPPEFDILGFGAVAVDDLIYVDQYPPAERKVRVRHRLRQCGGLTGTALVAAARLGSNCAYVGMLGNDELSLTVADNFAEEGIDLSHCVRRDDARAAHSTIIVDESRGTRTIFASLDGPIGAHPNEPDESLIRAAGVLLIDHHGLKGTLRAVRIGREAGVPVVSDIERLPEPAWEPLLDLVGHLILSERFAKELTGAENPALAAKHLWREDREAVVVTCGDRGCWYLDASTDQDAHHCPAFSIDVVDTTGCGDVFHGAYAAALAEGQDLPDRVVLASATAALKATKRGGQAGIPTRRVVEEFLAERG